MDFKLPKKGDTVEIRLHLDGVTLWIEATVTMVVDTLGGYFQWDIEKGPGWTIRGSGRCHLAAFRETWTWPLQPWAEHAQHQWTTCDDWYFCESEGCKVDLVPPTDEEWKAANER